MTDLSPNLPRNWAWTSLNKISWLDNGEECHGECLPYLEVRYLRGKKEAVCKNSGILVKKSDKVILVDGENSGEVFEIKECGYMGSTFRILRQSTAINSEFLQFFLDLHQKILRDNKTGSAIPHLNKQMFANLPIALPPISEQQRIVNAVNMLLYQVKLLQQ